ncbi:MAG: beta-galactosidase [Armatimonadota bacterium]
MKTILLVCSVLLGLITITGAVTAGVTVVNPFPYELRGYPVVLSPKRLNISNGKDMKTIAVKDESDGVMLPTQVDDLDRSGGLSNADEIVCLVSMKPYSAKKLSIVNGDQNSHSGIALEEKSDSYVLKTKNYSIGGNYGGGFYFQLPPAQGHLFDLKPWECEKLVYKSSGPVRLVLISEAKLADNGRLTRRIDAYPEFLKMTMSVGSADGKNDCLIKSDGGGAGAPGFYFDVPRMPDVKGLRYKTNYGYQDDLVNTPPISDEHFWGPGGPAIDFLCGDNNLAFLKKASADYGTGVWLCGPQRYFHGGIVFGWRPPIRVLNGVPLSQEICLIPHSGGKEEWQALDRVYRDGVNVAYNAVGIQAMIGAKKKTLDRLSTALANLSARKLKADVDAARGALGNGKGVESYITCIKKVDEADIVGGLQKIKSALADREAELKSMKHARNEMGPALAYLKKADVYLTAAIWDYNLNRYERALGRLESAGKMNARFSNYTKRPAVRMTPAQVKAGPVPPYVTFSEGVDKKQKDIGFDVCHFWSGMGQDTGWQSAFAVEPREGDYNWKFIDEAMETVRQNDMKVVPLLQYEVPEWFKKKYNPPDGYEALVDPKMLGYLPDHMKAWGEFMEKFGEHFGSWPEKVAWSVINEPAYYARGGATNSLLEKAIKNYLSEQYKDIAALNKVWATQFKSFDEIKLPASVAENKAAWYDVQLGKTKCFEGALKWQADLLTKNSTCKRTGGKFVPVCLSPYSVGSGWAVNPFANNKVQQGVSMTDLYLDNEWDAILRTQELYDSNKESPVLSLETGVASRPQERLYKFHIYPDAKAQSWAWTLFQHGLYGCHYWIWGINEEYSAQDWDGGVCDYAIQASLMNQNYRVYGDLLSTLRPVREIGYYYPYATFMQGKSEEIEPYQRLYCMLTEMGYQVKVFSGFNIDDVQQEFKYVIIPAVPYLERSVVPKLISYVENGGTLIVTGKTGVYDEHANPLGAFSYDGSEVSVRQVGDGREVFIPITVGMSFGEGVSVVELKGNWKFKFGDSWPQAPNNAATTLAGHSDAGMADKWYSADFDDSAWAEISVPGTWEENGYPDRDGWGWYRKTFTLPKNLKGKRVYLSGSSLDDRAKIYVNGKLVQETSTWDQRFQVDVSNYLNFGGPNTIAMMIEDNCSLGGVRGYISMSSPDLPKDDEVVLKNVLSGLGKTPETTAQGDLVFRTLMRDPHGNRYLLVSNTKNENVSASISVPNTIVAVKQAKVMDLFTGRRFAARQDKGILKVKVELGPCGVAFIPFGAVKTVAKKTASISPVTPAKPLPGSNTDSVHAPDKLVREPGESVILTFPGDAIGVGQCSIRLSEFVNESSYSENMDALEKMFTALVIQSLEKKGLRQSSNQQPRYRIDGQIAVFSVENSNEIIPFVNRWKKVTNAMVKARITVVNLADNTTAFNAEESAEQSHKGKEQVEFNVGNGSTPEPGIDTIDFGKGFANSLIGKCAVGTADKLAEKIAAFLAGSK